MGFCLLQEAGTQENWFAVNVEHVADVEAKEEGLCLIDVGFKPEGFTPLAVGTREAIQNLMMQASKIGIGKVEVQILSGRRNLRPTPLLLNNSGRVALVRELPPDEFSELAPDCLSASKVFYIDGTTRLITGRPGAFAYSVNAGNKVPMLKE